MLCIIASELSRPKPNVFLALGLLKESSIPYKASNYGQNYKNNYLKYISDKCHKVKKSHAYYRGKTSASP